MRANSVSVIICTWNRSDILRTTLLSLAAQSGCDDFDIEVIVVDNNSTDDTKAVVDSAALNWSLGELRYAFEPRQGKQFALNQGIRLSRNAILAFTDDDVIFPHDWISRIRQVFEEETLELVGGKTLLVWPASGAPSWYDPSMSAIVAGVELGDARLDPPPTGYAPAGTNLIARRSLIDKVGMYSEVHFRHMDYEFGVRCAQAGARVVYDPSLVVHTSVAGSCLSKRYFRRWSFKAGIANDGGEVSSAPTIFSLPRWVLRQWLEDLLFLAPRMLATDDPRVFRRELRLWRSMGTISSRWYINLRPGKYAEWVAKYSQKKKDVY